jgi:metal-dependent amidase/aminoacylase/carboxypeptidase family protein
MNRNQMVAGRIPASDHLKTDIDELVPDMVALRRDLHAHPELAYEEVRTSCLVAQRLGSLGLEVQVGVAQTGVVGLLRGGESSPGAKTLAIRADMDALPIHELNEIDADGCVLNVKGKGGHAAMPQEAVDPIVISAYIITALQTLLSRECSPFSPAVISIGTIQAGSAFNIIPETAQMQGTVRAFNQEVREQWLRRIREMATGVALAMGGSCEVQAYSGPPACVNDASMTHLVHEAAIASVGAGNVESSEEVMTTSSDDMAYFLQAVPGCYFIVGARNEQKGASYPHHHPRFTIDEAAMPIAVEVLARAAMGFLTARTPA